MARITTAQSRAMRFAKRLICNIVRLSRFCGCSRAAFGQSGYIIWARVWSAGLRGLLVRGVTKTDVFVIGGGPAGLAAAIAARARGMSVMLADGGAPPLEKPCGEGMAPDTIAALRELGVVIGPADGVKFRGIAFAQDGARVAADFPNGYGVGMRRVALHTRMVERAEECGVTLRWGTVVSGIESDGVRLTGGAGGAGDARIAARWIVGADGQQSRVRTWCGIETKFCSRRFASRRHFRVAPWSEYVEVNWSANAQAYVTPVAADEVCVVMLAARQEDAEFERALAEFPALRERIAGAELTSRERGTVTAMRELRRVQRGNVALIGDASGGVDAITGDGIRLGLRQATALAEVIAESREQGSGAGASDLRAYEARHRELARHPARMGFALLLLDHEAWLRRRVIRALAARPELFARTLAMHVGEARAADVASLGAMLGWRLLFN